MLLLRTVAISTVLLTLLIWSFFSFPFANHAGGGPSLEREPALRDNFYDVAMRGDLAWVVGYHGTILSSRDRGSSWALQPSGTKEALFRVSVVSENEAWISGSYGTLLHSGDGGKSWHRQQTPTEEHLFGLDFINERQGWAVGSRGTIIGTDDGGATWKDRSLGTDIVLNDVRFVDTRQGWAVGEFGRIYHTEDGGVTWTKQTSPIEVSFISGASRNLFRLLLSNRHGGWAFGLDGVILTSSDGKKWELTRQDDASAADLKHHHIFSASSAGLKKFAVGERGTVLVSQFDSRQWDPLSASSVPSNLNGIAFGEENTGLIVGNRGLILRSDSAGRHWTPVTIALNGRATGVH